MSHEPMSDAELAELERVWGNGTEGPCEARYMQDAIPVACVHFGVVSLSQGVETGRMWQRDDAEMYAALHNAFPRMLATIRQERERCALVAEEYGKQDRWPNGNDWSVGFASGQENAGEDIAARIRSGE